MVVVEAAAAAEVGSQASARLRNWVWPDPQVRSILDAGGAGHFLPVRLQTQVRTAGATDRFEAFDWRGPNFQPLERRGVLTNVQML